MTVPRDVKSLSLKNTKIDKRKVFVMLIHLVKLVSFHIYSNSRLKKSRKQLQGTLLAYECTSQRVKYWLFLGIHCLNINYNHLQKILEKLRKSRKSCNHKRNINRICNEKLHYNFLQQLPTLRLKT